MPSKRRDGRHTADRAQWLDRGLLYSPYYYALCLDPAQFRAELKRLKLPRDSWPKFLSTSHANATTHFFEKFDGKRCAIVALGGTEKRTDIQVHALLVHEAVHIWQEIRDTLGERSPSSEFEAYSIQALSQELMQSWHKQKSQRRR
jgi:hypothetical protein